MFFKYRLFQSQVYVHRIPFPGRLQGHSKALIPYNDLVLLALFYLPFCPPIILSFSHTYLSLPVTPHFIRNFPHMSNVVATCSQVHYCISEKPHEYIVRSYAII